MMVKHRVPGNDNNDWCHTNLDPDLHSFSVQITCDKDWNYSNWDFTQMDKSVNTFLDKIDNGIMLFSAKPDWEFNVNQQIKIGSIHLLEGHFSIRCGHTSIYWHLGTTETHCN